MTASILPKSVPFETANRSPERKHNKTPAQERAFEVLSDHCRFFYPLGKGGWDEEYSICNLNIRKSI